VVRRLVEAFVDVTVARKGVPIDASILPGFVATNGGGRPDSDGDRLDHPS